MVLRLTVTTPSDSAARFDFSLDAPRVTLGRSASCDVQLPYPTVSAHHLTIVREGEAWLVADTGSTNGTELNGEPLERDHFTPLHEGDVLTINDLTIQARFPLYVSGGVTTSEESGELVRRMAADYLRRVDPQEAQRAWLEVLQGPDLGERWRLPPGSWSLILGGGPGVGRWALRDESLQGESVTLASDGEVCSLHLAPAARTRVVVDGHAVVGGVTVRVRAGSRIQAGRNTILYVDPLDAYLRQLEAVPHKIRHTTSPFHRIDADEEPPPAEGFEPNPTQRIERASPLPLPIPRTAAGLPLHQGQMAGLASSMARAQAAAEEPPTRSRWSALDVALLSAALVLGIGALIVLLMVFGVL